MDHKNNFKIFYNRQSTSFLSNCKKYRPKYIYMSGNNNNLDDIISHLPFKIHYYTITQDMYNPVELMIEQYDI